jgi:N-acetylneuraminic acid mutarotase
MKYFIRLAVFQMFLCFNNFTFAQNWSQSDNFPGTARDDGSSFKIGDKVYCGTGLQVGWSCTNDFYAFDLPSETWSPTASLPSNMERQYAYGCAVLNKGYIFGGANDAGNYLNDLWEYNPSTNAWIQKAPLPANGRSGGMTFVVNDKMYVVGGKTFGFNALDETWRYDPILNSWTRMADFPLNGTWRGVAFSYNNLGYVGLGKDNAGIYNTMMYSYDPLLDSWTLVPSFTTNSRTYTGAAQIGQFAYLFGGVDNSGTITTTFEKIDLSDFSTVVMNPFSNTPRKGCMAFASADAFYITTGVSTAMRFNETWKADYILALDESNKQEINLVYPNPNTGNFTLTLELEGVFDLKIVDIAGKVILSQEQIKVTNPFVIELPTVNAGIYFLTITNGKQTWNQKIVLEK